MFESELSESKRFGLKNSKIGKLESLVNVSIENESSEFQSFCQCGFRNFRNLIKERYITDLIASK